MDNITHIPKKDNIYKILKSVIDPEIGLNIVDLGLIYAIDIDKGQDLLKVTMTLTTSGCPMGDIIISDVEKTLEDSFPEYKSAIELVWEPAWNQDMISAEGLIYLES